LRFVIAKDLQKR